MEIRFLSAGCGDAVHIRFEGDDNKLHNILIDGGVERGDVYEHGIKQALTSILNNNEIIDLWIISHIDDDHIGGLLRFIQDKSLFEKFDFSKTQFWYNTWHSDYPVRIGRSTKKSLKQGIRLREFLATNSQVKSFVTDQSGTQSIFGAKLTLLSPNAEKLTGLLAKWEWEEIMLIKKTRKTKKLSKRSDYNKLIESFDLSGFTEDTSEENGSSIAFLLSYHSKTVLFSADSHPTVLCASLRRLGFSESNKLKLECLQLSHHASKFNTNAELIELIECENYVISADGYNNANLPNKETLVRVIKRGGNPLSNFYITHRNRRTSNIFKVDTQLRNVRLHFPPDSTPYLSFLV